MSEQKFINQILGATAEVDSPEEFHHSVLSLLASRYQAAIAIIWARDEGQFFPETQVQLNDQVVPELNFSESEHQTLLVEAAGAQEPQVLRDISSDSNWCLAVSAFGQTVENRVLELLFPLSSDTPENGQVARDLALCTKFLNIRDRNGQSYGQQAIEQNDSHVSEFAELVHQSIDLSETSDTVANELRRTLEVDRVSVLCKKGKKWIVRSVSGQVSVNRRSGLLRRLEDLANRSLVTGQTLCHPSSEDQLPQISDSLRVYLEQSETRSIIIKPVAISEKPDDIRQAENPNAAKSTIIAGVAIENYRHVLDEENFMPSFESYFVHAASALKNAYRHKQLFLYPVWRFIGKSKIVTAARNLPTTLSVIAAVLFVFLVLFFVPAKFNVIADGVLVPVERQRVFAELSGIIVDVPIDHESQVSKGQVLLNMVNEDLAFQTEQVSGEILELEQRLSAIQASRITGSSGADSAQESNVKGIRTQLQALERLFGTLNAKSERLKVVSPISGEVITWDVKDRLLNRPVQPSELLVEVANVDGDWELVVDVPSRKAGHILRAINSLGELKVVYAIASEPGVWLEGHVIEIDRSARLQADQTQTISLRVKIELEKIEYPANTGVVARVFCGKKSLGYVWAHDAWEYVQENIIFRIW